MTDETIELMLASEDAVNATHFPPNGDSEPVRGLFSETEDDSTDYSDTREGNKRVRKGKLVIRTGVVVTLGNKPSKFTIRDDESWTAMSVIAGPRLQTVRLERISESTLGRPNVRPRQ